MNSTLNGGATMVKGGGTGGVGRTTEDFHFGQCIFLSCLNFI